MSTYFTAEQAKELLKKAKRNKYELAKKSIINQIKLEASRGNTRVQVRVNTEIIIQIINWLQNLGYKVNTIQNSQDDFPKYKFIVINF